MSQTFLEYRQSEPQTNLVECTPVKEDTKLSPISKVLGQSWQEFQALSWLMMDEY